MAFTQTQLDALDAALAEGTLKVEYGDKKVEYRSFNEMVKLRNLMAAEIAGPDNRKNKRTLASFSKGVYPHDCQ